MLCGLARGRRNWLASVDSQYFQLLGGDWRDRKITRAEKTLCLRRFSIIIVQVVRM
jgi:hypothetical protein